MWFEKREEKQNIVADNNSAIHAVCTEQLKNEIQSNVKAENFCLTFKLIALFCRKL